MRVYIKNKVFSFGGDSNVLDEEQKPIYNIKGKFMSLHNSKKIFDLEGNLLYQVKKKLFSLFLNAIYIYDKDGNKVAKIKEHMSFKNPYVVSECGDPYQIVGRIFDRNMTVYRGNDIIGTITRNITFANDAFTLDADEKDIPLLIAFVIAIDNLTDDRKNENVTNFNIGD